GIPARAAAGALACNFAVPPETPIRCRKPAKATSSSPDAFVRVTLMTLSGCSGGRQRVRTLVMEAELSASWLGREAAADEDVELGDGELVQAVGGAVDQSFLD